jgi:hypothetical protein
MENGIVDVWPDFLERKNAAIYGKIRNPALVGLGQRPFLARIVKICNS